MREAALFGGSFFAFEQLQIVTVAGVEHYRSGPGLSPLLPNGKTEGVYIKPGTLVEIRNVHRDMMKTLYCHCRLLLGFITSCSEKFEEVLFRF